MNSSISITGFLFMLLILPFMAIASPAPTQHHESPALTIHTGFPGYMCKNPMDSFPITAKDVEKIRRMTFSARAAFRLTGGYKRYDKTLAIFGNVKNTASYRYAAPYDFHPVQMPEAYRLRKYTRQDSLLEAAELPTISGSSRKTEKIWINYLLGSFITGTQPENILFPTDGIVSNSMRNSTIVRKALKAYHQRNLSQSPELFVLHAKFKPINAPRIALKIMSLQHYIASAYIVIHAPNDSTLHMAIFNVTSITSADFATIFSKPHQWNPSFLRKNSPDPYGNIAQIYQLTFSTEDRPKPLRRYKTKNTPSVITHQPQP